MKRGLWVDCAPGRILSDLGAYLGAVRGLGVEVVAPMCQDTAGRWLWSVAQVELLAAGCRLADLELVLTTWPMPSALDDWERELAERAEYGASGIEVDLEGQWRGERAARASAELVDRLAALGRRFDARTEVTTFPSHPEAGPAARVSPHVDRLNLQVYSIRHRPGGRLVDPRGRYGPGRYQREALAAARPGASLGVGLAAYAQDWPALSPGEAIALAREGVADSGSEIDEERWWSSKWVLGKFASAWAAEAIRNLVARSPV